MQAPPRKAASLFLNRFKGAWLPAAQPFCLNEDDQKQTCCYKSNRFYQPAQRTVFISFDVFTTMNWSRIGLDNNCNMLLVFACAGDPSAVHISAEEDSNIALPDDQSLQVRESDAENGKRQLLRKAFTFLHNSART